MSLQAFNAGCNILAFHKAGRNYGMCCAWAQMLDYDRISLLVGAQSVTGDAIERGDIVGVSALAKGQEHVARRLGEGHNDVVDKFDGLPTTHEGMAILISGAKVRMVCEVLDVMRLSGIEADRFIVMKVLNATVTTEKPFLSADFE